MTQRPDGYIGGTPLKFSESEVHGYFVEIEGESFYTIQAIEQMEPFFISLVSPSDQWMFISSNGALTAGRKKPDMALFPYYTVDKIYDSAEITGSKTIIWAKRPDKSFLWDPFSDRLEGVYNVTRNLYKNISGNRIVFEEINFDLQLKFSYQWCASEKFGFIKKSVCANLSDEIVQIELLDGIQNIMPQGVDRMMQSDKSCLVDAYKKSELIPETGLGVYRLSSIPVDRAEPSEALKANTVWSFGAGTQRRLLSSVQLGLFRRSQPIHEEREVRGKRGAYFLNIECEWAPHQSRTWYLAAEVNQTAADVAALQSLLSSRSDIDTMIEDDLREGTLKLNQLVASADGLQLTHDRLTVSRHSANVLFNIMRGGIFDEGYLVSKSDLRQFAAGMNSMLFEQNAPWFEALSDSIHYEELLRRAWEAENPGLIRICLEYLPLTFGRRHGDPSRPWNLFAIETRQEDGSKNLNYQGNWRDIFQNWEALALSFPGFIESMISKFVNASTVDGYNPYRVTRGGFEWEIQDPHDPWSFIGYWGDHQTIYLLKLLEISHSYHPGQLHQLLEKEIFSFANVPYRIRPYSEVLSNPYHSIDYDAEMEKRIGERIKACGADGKLVWGRAEDIYRVNLTEKLLVSLLSKLSNFVPEGGIWMNTQRPEWNDANNALAGFGLSMVTLYYLRRYVKFCRMLFSETSTLQIVLSREVADFLHSIHSIFRHHEPLLSGGFNNRTRKTLLDALGETGSTYRLEIYFNGFSESRCAVSSSQLLDFFSITLKFIDQSISANQRPDRLFHAYNLLSLKGSDEAEVVHLYEMLEGQVAILSSGFLSAAQASGLLEALRKSAMFREDQYSYLLYPDRSLPGFMDKNNIPNEVAQKSKLFQTLISHNNRQLVEKDIDGVLHFHGSFANKNILSKTLLSLAEHGYAELVEQERDAILKLYEEMFKHKSFTGRSGSFFSYEGLGSIYWHMVSKLMLAAQAAYSEALENGETPEVLGRLRQQYYDIRLGLGTYKPPAVYGAFPIDPYSHTPGHSGAQQPGMTGQVKEDIIARFRELGLVVSMGQIRFEPSLLQPDEFLVECQLFEYFDVNGRAKKLELEPGTLAFTYCQLPIVLKKSNHNSIRLIKAGETKLVDGLQLSPEDSQSIFTRNAEIQLMVVEMNVA
jgi:hypothetical protein